MDKIGKEIGYKNFPFHIELRIDKDKIIPIEINPMRFCGWCITDIAQNAYAAALNDRRFNPVTVEELDKIKISISFLTGYERMIYQDEEDLLKMIEAGTDGMVIRDGNRQGLFLPSVWEQIPDKKEFLQNLKLKAGMSPSYWSNSIKVYRFRTVEIKENEN